MAKRSIAHILGILLAFTVSSVQGLAAPTSVLKGVEKEKHPIRSSMTKYVLSGCLNAKFKCECERYGGDQSPQGIDILDTATAVGGTECLKNTFSNAQPF